LSFISNPGVGGTLVFGCEVTVPSDGDLTGPNTARRFVTNGALSDTGFYWLLETRTGAAVARVFRCGF
jgi:hypothetical protein